MSKLRYVGPHPSVFFETREHGAYAVEQGKTIDVPDEELVTSLLEQPSNWELAGAKKATNDPAAADEESE